MEQTKTLILTMKVAKASSGMRRIAMVQVISKKISVMRTVIQVTVAVQVMEPAGIHAGVLEA